MSRYFIALGLIFILIGLVWPMIKKLNLGHLPGDIILKGNGMSFYFPIVSCLILSFVVSLIVAILKH